MPVNPYFINYNLNGDNTNEQSLVNALVQESIQIHGIDCFYLPRKNDGLQDTLLGEDILTYFDEKFEIEVYPIDADSFGGPPIDLNGPHGWQVKDTMKFQVSTLSWSDIIGDVYRRPREGDLLYFPLTGTIFNIVFVEDENQFYPRGTLPSWELDCEIFDYNHEYMDTGIEGMDDINDDIDLTDESIFDIRHPDNKTVETETDLIKDPSNDSDIWGQF